MFVQKRREITVREVSSGTLSMAAVVQKLKVDGSDADEKTSVERARGHKDIMDAIQEDPTKSRKWGEYGGTSSERTWRPLGSIQTQWSTPLILSNDVVFGLWFPCKSTKYLYPTNIY